jgi:hypothetical protein
MVHTCPRCELRFMNETELHEHLTVDHHTPPEAFERLRYHGGSEPVSDDGTRRYLVVANQTLHNDDLVERLRGLAASGPASFVLLVPATPAEVAASESVGDPGVALASYRARTMVDRLQNEGFAIRSEVGHPDPFHAATTLLAHEHFDEIVVSTLPPGLSRWLRADLPHRVRRTFELPVSWVAASVAA